MAKSDQWTASSIEQVRVEDLLPYARNARTHSAAQVRQIAASIREFGFVNPVLVDEAGEIIAGHGRVMAARQIGLDVVPVIRRTGLTAAQKRGLRLADNKIALGSGWDDALLAAELAELASIEGFDVSVTGFDVADIDAIIRSATGADAPMPLPDGDETDAADAEVEQPRERVTRTGDLWRLGGHRLLCGDSTNAENVVRLLGGKSVDLLFTSPPYGQQRNYTTGGIGDWDVLMQGVFAHLDLALAQDAQVLVNLGMIHRDSEWQPYWTGWLDWMRGQGWRRFGLYVWDQGPGLPGDWNGRLAPSFEFVFHFNRQARQANKIIPCRWAGHVNGSHGGLRNKDGTVTDWQHAGQGVQETRIPDNVVRITRHKARGIETEHPAVFPVKLPEFLMRAFTNEGDVVFEPFAGSGTTILAGQRTDRIVRAIELAPAYVDLAVARWRVLHPDIPVTLDGDGRSYDDIAKERSDG